MFKKVLTVSTVTAMLLLSGCGSNDAEGKLDTQKMLDDGDYDGVIAKFEDAQNPTNEERMALASSYMGRAGVSFPDLIKIMIDSLDDDSGEGFANFATALADNKNSTTLLDLGKAAENYEGIMSNLGSATCISGDELTTTQESICLYLGLSYTAKTASTLSYLGNLENFGEEGGESDDKLKASECAMQYAFNGIYDTDECTVNDTSSTVEFKEIDTTYGELGMIVDGKEYEFLTKDNQTIITDGYCKKDNINAVETAESYENKAGYYPCPLNKTKGKEISSLAVLVDTLNNGTDSVAAASGDDSDIAEDIEEFKKEVRPDGGTITEQDILDYLAEQN